MMMMQEVREPGLEAEGKVKEEESGKQREER